MSEQSKFFNSVKGAFGVPQEQIDPQAEAMKQRIKQDALAKLQGQLIQPAQQPVQQSVPDQSMLPVQQPVSDQSMPLQQSLINYFKNRQNGQ